MNRGGLQAEVQNLRGKTKTSLARAWLLFQRAASVHTRDDGGGHFLFPNTNFGRSPALSLRSQVIPKLLHTFTNKQSSILHYVTHKHTTLHALSASPHRTPLKPTHPKREQSKGFFVVRCWLDGWLAVVVVALLALPLSSPSPSTPPPPPPEKLKIPYKKKT